MSQPLYLEQLISNKKSSPLILINDSIRLSALPLLCEFSRRALTEDKHQVIVILTETLPSTLLQAVGSNINLHIIDASTDPYGWENQGPIISEKDTQGCGSFVRLTRLSEFEKHLLPLVMELLKKMPSSLIIVESLNPLARLSAPRTYRFVKALESLTADIIRVIVGYHTDIRSITASFALPLSDSLNRLASVIIKLDQLKAPTAQTDVQAKLTGFVAQDTFSYLQITSNHITRGGLAKIEWRRKSGKVLYETNGFYIDQQHRRLMVVPASLLGVENDERGDEDNDDDGEGMRDRKETDRSPDPTANLSFNLSLTEQQRKIKENLVLPYFKAQHVEIDGASSHNSAGGAIYYEPDAADDFDDEDPDEDLDI